MKVCNFLSNNLLNCQISFRLVGSIVLHWELKNEIKIIMSLTDFLNIYTFFYRISYTKMFSPWKISVIYKSWNITLVHKKRLQRRCGHGQGLCNRNTLMIFVPSNHIQNQEAKINGKLIPFSQWCNKYTRSWQLTVWFYQFFV